jgi:hypothetical protein
MDVMMNESRVRNAGIRESYHLTSQQLSVLLKEDRVFRPYDSKNTRRGTRTAVKLHIGSSGSSSDATYH